MSPGTQHLRYLYWRFIVLGIATLMAWNVYIVSSDYFRYVFRNTPFRDNFESIFSVLSNSCNLATLSYALYTQPKANHDRRIKNGIWITVCAFVLISMLPAAGAEGWVAVTVSLVALVAAAVAAAYIQCSVYGIVAMLPSSCAEGFMSGQAIAGTIASAAQLVSVYWSKDSVKGGDDKPLVDYAAASALADDIGDVQLRIRTAVYFYLSAVFLALSMIVWKQLNNYLAMPRMSPSGAYEALQLPLISHTNDIEDDGQHAPALVDGPPLPAWISRLGLTNAHHLYITYSEISPYVHISIITMAQTLAVFPPLTEAIVSSPNSLPQIAHLNAWHFLLFNIGDYLGRLCTQWVTCSRPKVLHWVNGLRTLFIPVFLLFPTVATLPGSLTIHSDLLFLLLVLAMGWTNGWVATSALILGPCQASDKGLAGSILGFALCVGLVIGAVASYPILLLAGIS
ncbi:nucleoside transporter-domain-containing protein [Kickxella alabastrina]|uniref:nucleoside transporter-domain-containing protein n=1 Tax=Kickxella alabastrina TaxID=61397 RepID=UPI0022212236|nr:nucleoside transporter-domain-containing protein [Kickxella alabastrina]KAI7835000.1 nucleoside transporter-domain-containing protein [Kickxella alabastrina]KAJ1947632.1 hypothetical protein GGF37_000215 [Kickxella alabastrina]